MKRFELVLALSALCAAPAAQPVQQQQPVDAYEILVDYYQEAFGLAGDPVELAAPDLFAQDLLAKALADDCYSGMGLPRVSPPCAVGIPKVDQAYVWGLTQVGRTLWFGTGANVACLEIGTTLGQTTPFETPYLVCEFGQSYGAQTVGIPAAIGDTREPEIWSYDLDAPPATALTQHVLSGAADMRLKQTTGLRAAGAHRGVVFLAGPARNLAIGVSLFAFDAASGAFLGLANLPQFDSVGSWRVLDGELYAGFGHAPTWPGGGSVMRWTGSLADPFQFEPVGVLGSEVFDLALHEGRVYVTTSSDASTGEPASLYESPPVPPGGLTFLNQLSWTRIWGAEQYEPDPLCLMTYGGGAVASHAGWLYWGTRHVPGLAYLNWIATFGPPSSTKEIAQVALGTHRATALFKIRTGSPGGNERECIYGMEKLPVYDPLSGWTLRANGMNPPSFGVAGFGNLFNAHTWSMQSYQGRLFVGTLDWSYLLGLVPLGPAIPAEFEFLGARRAGADLWCFPADGGPARLVSANGLGNETTIGVRTLSADGKGLYLGMANPINLHPLGGWELRELRIARDTVDGIGPPRRAMKP